MSHEIDSTKGFSAIAYKGDVPWHKLGQQMQAGQSIEQWQQAAGMDFTKKFWFVLTVVML